MEGEWRGWLEAAACVLVNVRLLWKEGLLYGDLHFWKSQRTVRSLSSRGDARRPLLELTGGRLLGIEPPTKLRWESPPAGSEGPRVPPQPVVASAHPDSTAVAGML